MPQIFISYSRKDSPFAGQLVKALTGRGFEVWIDRKIRAGTQWSRTIQQALRASQIMIVVMSPESMASNNVEDEWQYFLDRQKPIIPVKIKPTDDDMHFQLNRIQYIDFHAKEFNVAFEELVAEINEKLASLPPS